MATHRSAHDIDARHAEIIGKPPRVEPLKPNELTPEAREIALSLTRALGMPDGDDPSEVIATMMHHPRVFREYLGLARELFRTDLPFRDRELVILTIGWRTQAPFEWGEHVKIAKMAGLTSEEIERVKQGSSAPGWSDDDRDTLKAVEELLGDAMITDATWERLSRRLDAKQLSEICVLAGQYQGVAYLANSLRVRLTPGGEGLKAI